MTTPIRKTLLYLILIQGGNYIVPLLMLPYLGRVLGVREFGVLALCQAVTQYLVLLTDYGYNFTATRLVSVRRNDPQGLAEHWGRIIGIPVTKNQSGDPELKLPNCSFRFVKGTSEIMSGLTFRVSDIAAIRDAARAARGELV